MRGMRERSAVLLDRHPLWMDALEALMEGLEIEVVGRAADCDEALALVDEFRPDVLVAGIDVWRSDELTCVRRATQAHPGLRAVVVGESDDLQAVATAFGAGASAYCVKTAQQEDVASAIRQIFERSIYLAGEAAAPAAHAATTEEVASAAELTKRELEILRLVAEGHSNSQLAKMLWVTEQTVKFHLSNIYRKLDVANRTEASRWAQLNGLLPAQREAAVGAAA